MLSLISFNGGECLGSSNCVVCYCGTISSQSYSHIAYCSKFTVVISCDFWYCTVCCCCYCCFCCMYCQLTHVSSMSLTPWHKLQSNHSHRNDSHSNHSHIVFAIFSRTNEYRETLPIHIKNSLVSRNSCSKEKPRKQSSETQLINLAVTCIWVNRQEQTNEQLKLAR